MNQFQAHVTNEACKIWQNIAAFAGHEWITPQKSNIAPERWWLEDYCPFGKVTLQEGKGFIIFLYCLHGYFFFVLCPSQEAANPTSLAANRISFRISMSVTSPVDFIRFHLTNRLQRPTSTISGLKSSLADFAVDFVDTGFPSFEMSGPHLDRSPRSDRSVNLINGSLGFMANRSGSQW